MTVQFSMNPTRRSWLRRVGHVIPRVLVAVESGRTRAGCVIGTRTIDGRAVVLDIRAELVDPGRNPLQTHGNAVQGAAPASREPPMPGTGDSE